MQLSARQPHGYVHTFFYYIYFKMLCKKFLRESRITTTKEATKFLYLSIPAFPSFDSYFLLSLVVDCRLEIKINLPNCCFGSELTRTKTFAIFSTSDKILFSKLSLRIAGLVSEVCLCFKSKFIVFYYGSLELSSIYSTIDDLHILLGMKLMDSEHFH